jgi:FAD/FMN-containing dehydrogenase
MLMPVDQLQPALAAIVGPVQVLTEPDVVAGYTIDWTGRWRGQARMVVRPGSTAEVAGVVRACAEAGGAVVPQGGNTGLVGGGVPAQDSRQPAIILSLVRLTELEAVDVAAAQVTSGAGVRLADLHAHVAGSGTGLAFAVDLAARDTATIGGMIATNAGGIHVVRYGGMRAQVVGVEAVLADASVITRLDGLLKDNSGYDLSQLLIGSEGTLGIVTRARLRLIPALPVRYTALLGLPDTQHAVQLVSRLRREVASLEAAEVFYPEGLRLVMGHGGLPAPLPRPWGAYLLIECAGHDESVLDELAAVADDLGGEAAAVGLDPTGRQRLWAYRERHTEAVNTLGVPHKLDVTLPIGQLAAFEADVRQVVESVAPGSTVIIWGHIGDGNLHVNVVGPAPDDDTADDAVLRLVARLGGSISAEHGIGRAKVGWLPLTRSPAEMAAMAAIKDALDPSGLLNPGVIFSSKDRP